ncbi:MAG TPA: divalent-cation tolerance protein CutA [Candidatus Acidoferrales bacterium]|nr:divalent-cation tolerance protein CutA [Candidatus Acidoferrales bacterium]
MSRNVVVLVTCGSAKEAKSIADALVRKRLAACVNVLTSPVRSIYRWKGIVETAKEYLLVIKTSSRRFAGLEKEIRRLHSYEAPEIIALPIAAGSKPYLKWLEASVNKTEAGRKRK